MGFEPKAQSVDAVYSQNAPIDYQMNEKATLEYDLLQDILNLCSVYAEIAEMLLKDGKSSQLRFLHGRPVVPIGYVQSRNAQHKRKSVNKYTPEGRELIHKNLNIDTKTMLWLMRNPVQGRSIEYADNRISLYAAQHGKCAVTGSIMEAHEVHCHHKKPVAKGGTDEYGNLVLISAPVHKLIHASDKATIKFYLNLLNLDSTQISKLNKFREMAEMPLID